MKSKIAAFRPKHRLFYNSMTGLVRATPRAMNQRSIRVREHLLTFRGFGGKKHRLNLRRPSRKERTGVVATTAVGAAGALELGARVHERIFIDLQENASIKNGHAFGTARMMKRCDIAHTLERDALEVTVFAIFGGNDFTGCRNLGACFNTCPVFVKQIDFPVRFNEQDPL